MDKPSLPLHGVRQTAEGNWELWSVMLQFAVPCGAAADARRLLAALEYTYPRGAAVDFSAVDVATATEPPASSVAKVRLH